MYWVSENWWTVFVVVVTPAYTHPAIKFNFGDKVDTPEKIAGSNMIVWKNVI